MEFSNEANRLLNLSRMFNEKNEKDLTACLTKVCQSRQSKLSLFIPIVDYEYRFQYNYKGISITYELRPKETTRKCSFNYALHKINKAVV